MARAHRVFAALLPALCALPLLATPGLGATEELMQNFPEFNPKFCPNTVSRQKIDPSMASDCKGIIIPWGMCRNCHMRTHDAKGEFTNNRDMFDLSLPKCERALRYYTVLNRCDWPRVAHVNQYYAGLKGKLPPWRTAFFQRKLGEFMYNVCELCCDCVPIGLNRSRTLDQEYEVRKSVDNWWTGPKQLIEIYRGNCPVHYYYDTCRMWPNLRDVASSKKWLNTNKDRICQDHVYPWWFSKNNYRRNWLRDPKVVIPSQRFVQFLVKINNVLGCRDKRVWKDCARLELAQGRV